MIVLKIIGFVLLGIIALIILALCVKVKIFAEYSEIDTHVKLKWLFLEIPLYPAKKKESNENKTNSKSKEDAPAEEVSVEEAAAEDEVLPDGDEGATEKEQTEENKEKPKNNLLKTIYEAHGVDGLLLIVQRVFSYLGTFLGNLMHSLVIEELYIDVKCNKNDAASTAIYYGEVCSSLFPMLGALVTKYKVKKYDINVYPDYLARHSSASFAVSMHLYPIYVIGITFALVFKLLFKVLLSVIVKCFRATKNTAENKKTGSANESAA